MNSSNNVSSSHLNLRSTVLLVIAMGSVLAIIGCGDPKNPDGTGGTGGAGGTGGTGGTAECMIPEDCWDGDECIVAQCADGTCSSTPAADGTACTGGECLQGVCDLTLPCTEEGIRAAIAEGGGPHVFACDGPTTVVTSAEIVIDNDVILDGESLLTVDGDVDHRVFSVETDITAELRGITVVGGAARDGGGILNVGALTLTDCTVSDNTATRDGGGISNTLTGTLTLTNSTVSDNSAADDGGGIFNDRDAELELKDSTVTVNEATDHGGGINNAGSAMLTGSTVSNNTSTDNGGGIDVELGVLTLTNSTVSGNKSMGAGGGIENRGTLTLTSSTVSGNESMGSGDAIFNWSLLTLTNSLLDGECGSLFGIFTSVGGNLESPGDTCFLDQPSDQVSVTVENLALGPLQDNGGRTMTHALLPGSFAVDHIAVASCEVDVDQGGVSRPQGEFCDVGAFEVEQ